MTTVTAVARSGNMQASPSASPALKAPLFGSLVERMDNDQRTVVLDLGAAQGNTIMLFNQFRCSLDIADLAASLPQLNAIEAEADLPAAVARLLPPQRPTDVVLCWDLPNYLQRPALQAFMQGLLPRLQAGSLVHMLISYSATRMAAQPGSYHPRGRDHLVCVPVTEAQVDSPRYTPQSLGQCMPDYQLEKAMLLRNGLQEFLFRVE